MDTPLPLISLACRANTDADALQRFHSALFPVLRALESVYRFDIVYVGADHDPDTRARVQSLAQLDPRIRVHPAVNQASDAANIGRQDGTATLVIDVSAHSPDIVPQLLEAAKGPAALVVGIPQQAPPQRSWRRWLSSVELPPILALLKRPALEALKTAGARPLSEALTALNVPRAELVYVPNRANEQATSASVFRRIIADFRDTWARAPLALISYFGGAVFVIGVFLAVWFAVQGVVAPGNIWFSWCYLIVLLHILGGSILYALGKLGALASRILEQGQTGPMTKPQQRPATPASSVVAPLMQPSRAA